MPLMEAIAAEIRRQFAFYIIIRGMINTEQKRHRVWSSGFPYFVPPRRRRRPRFSFFVLALGRLNSGEARA